MQTSQMNESTLRPTIDETSRKIIEEKMAERGSKPTYERLYELNKEKMQKHAENVMKQPAQPEKKIVKRENLEQTLYEDAQRRKTELEIKKKELDKERMKPKEGKFVNDKSDKYVIKRFDKELKQAETELYQEEGYDNTEEMKKES